MMILWTYTEGYKVRWLDDLMVEPQQLPEELRLRHQGHLLYQSLRIAFRGQCLELKVAGNDSDGPNSTAAIPVRVSSGGGVPAAC